MRKTTQGKAPAPLASVLTFPLPARPESPPSTDFERLKAAIDCANRAVASKERKSAIIARDELQAAQWSFIRAVVDSAYCDCSDYGGGFSYPLQALARGLQLVPELRAAVLQLLPIIDAPAANEIAEVIDIRFARRILRSSAARQGVLPMEQSAPKKRRQFSESTPKTPTN